MSTRWSKARPLAAFPRPAPRAPPDRTKALAENEIAALWRLDVALRETMLEEIPRLNVEDLHPGDERGRTLAKGGATEWIHWHSGTAQKVDTPAAWKQARAAGMLQAAQCESSGPMAVAPDGSSVIAASRRDGRVTLVWLRDQGRERTTIYTVADSARVASAWLTSTAVGWSSTSLPRTMSAPSGSCWPGTPGPAEPPRASPRP
ncbi:hypothetical protein ACFCYH_14715 [Streptomyces sp. NPDC056400]|uniref:hypothetical protein n=1 Tax=Streptomyces sp. NPDC056400 TaxID=3345808 RepID=UPI0035DF1976